MATSRTLAGGMPNSDLMSFVKGDEHNASIIETSKSKERRKRSETLLGGTEMKQFGKVMRN